MLIQPIDYFFVVWFVLAAASTLYVAVDQFRNNHEPTVMRWGFILVTLYMGPFGVLLYVMADKEPRPGEHETFVAPLWRQGVGSTIHCVAGVATGIILAVRLSRPRSAFPCGSISSSSTWPASPSGCSCSSRTHPPSTRGEAEAEA